MRSTNPIMDTMALPLEWAKSHLGLWSILSPNRKLVVVYNMRRLLDYGVARQPMSSMRFPSLIFALECTINQLIVIAAATKIAKTIHNLEEMLNIFK